jgi:NADH-quinone oxidoreductase subunit M
LPGFSGFIAEILVILGTWKAVLMPTAAVRLPLWTAIVPLAGLLVGAGYCLWTVQRLLFGEYWTHPTLEHPAPLPDLTVRERWLLGSLGVAVIGLGLFPAVLLNGISPAAVAWVAAVRTALL